MRAARLHAYGSPVVVEDVADPLCRNPDDVVVRVGAAGLCRTDLHIADGVFAHLSKPLPTVLGHEAAGWVHAVGSSVIGCAAGEAVAMYPQATCGTCPSCRSGRDQFCERFQFLGAGIDGGFAEYVVVPQRALVPIRDLDVDVAAGLADGGLAAYGAVRRVRDLLLPGTTAVVIGVGGVGHVAVQLLRALTPAMVVAVDTSPAALSLATSLGAHDAVLADGTHVDAVRGMHGGGADVVFDCVGDGGTPADGLRLLRRQGTYVAVGYGGRLDVATADLVFGGWTVIGSTMGSWTDLTELLALAERGLVSVRTRAYPLSSIASAMDDLRAGRIVGRAVIHPGA